MSRSAGNESADPSCPLSLSEGRFGSLLSTRCRIPARLEEDMVGLHKETQEKVTLTGFAVIQGNVGLP